MNNNRRQPQESSLSDLELEELIVIRKEISEIRKELVNLRKGLTYSIINGVIIGFVAILLIQFILGLL